MPVSVITLSWRCLPATEREACDVMASQAVIAPFFVLAVTIDLIFEAQSAIDPVIRREAWEQLTESERVTIGDPPLEVTGYFATDAWCLELWACRVAGDCLLTDPQRDRKSVV